MKNTGDYVDIDVAANRIKIFGRFESPGAFMKLLGTIKSLMKDDVEVDTSACEVAK